MPRQTAQNDSLTRRHFLVGFAWCAGGVLMHSGWVMAAVMLTKEAVAYTLQPGGAKPCKECSHFLKGETPISEGRCAVVKGGVSPYGHCVVWSPRNPIEGC